MKTPIVAWDGCYYEKSAAQEYFKNNTLSPVTGQHCYDEEERMMFMSNSKLREKIIAYINLCMI